MKPSKMTYWILYNGKSKKIDNISQLKKQLKCGYKITEVCYGPEWCPSTNFVITKIT